MTQRFKRKVESLEPGDHLSLLYETRDQQLAGLIPVFREALSRGDRCLYLVDEETWGDIEKDLADAGLPITEEQERGLLEISSSRDVFFGDGEFNPDGMVQLYEDALERARSDGFDVLWWIGESSWFLGECLSEDVQAMESMAQEATRSRDLIVVCQYDRTRLDDDAVFEVLAAHPLAILGDEVFPNIYYKPPEVVLAEEGLTRVDWMIRELKRHRTLRAELEGRERELKAVMDHSPDLIVRMDRQHRYLYANPAAEKFTGIPVEERLGRAHEEVFPDPGATRPWMEAVDRAFETGKEQTVEASYETPEEERWFQTRIIPESENASETHREEDSEDGGIPAVDTVLLFARDITDRVRAEQESHRFEKLYRDFFRLSRDGIFISTLDGTIVDLNPAALEIVAGEEVDDLNATTLRRELGETNVLNLYADPARREELLRALESGPVQDFPVRIRRPDGTPVEVLLTAIPWRNDRGEMVGIKGIVRDVTEEVVQRRQLEQTTRLFEKTLSSLDEAVFVVETPSREIVHCNEAAERMFGYIRSEMIEGSTEMLHVDEEHHRRFGTETGEAVESGETFRGEFEMRRKDGSVFPTFHTVTPLDSELGLESAVVSVVRDLTRQKRLERRLQEIARQERRRLGHDLHDDLGQELTALALQANELRRRLDRQDGSLVEVADALEDGINQAIQSVRHVARGLLPEELEGRGIGEVLEELARERQRSLGVEVEVDVDPAIRFGVEEAAHLYRIAQEALLNAFRHGRASSVVIRIFHEDDHRVLRVRDDGMGFEGAGSGSMGEGMGLQVMRHRAEAMGGRLEVESRPGWGTTVTCILPRTPTTTGVELP